MDGQGIPQNSILTAAERKTHAEDIYFSLPDHADIKGKNILLFDDVNTTGATLNVCSRLLKEMGAKKVFCAAIATTLLDEKHKRIKRNAFGIIISGGGLYDN